MNVSETDRRERERERVTFTFRDLNGRIAVVGVNKKKLMLIKLVKSGADFWTGCSSQPYGLRISDDCKMFN